MVMRRASEAMLMALYKLSYFASHDGSTDSNPMEGLYFIISYYSYYTVVGYNNNCL